MPKIASGQIGVALDMQGCPNRCRHCYVGSLPNRRMSEDDLRWAVGRFKDHFRDASGGLVVEKLSVCSWGREPDFSDNYERLAALEAELGDGQPTRYELLSVWRLARDADYARWAKRIGPDTCQISFFGLERTQDFFHRRRGAFQDCLRAAERLLEAGMKPRWQLFLTKKILPDLGGLMKLIERMRIRQRVEALGGEFVMFIHPPALVGEGRKIAHLSATLEDTKLVPAELAAATRKHFDSERIWTTEAETVARIADDAEAVGPPYPYPSPKLWFLVAGNWDVFSNMGTTDPWWGLGNLKREPVQAILESFENDRILPLKVNRAEMLQELARRYGDPHSRRVVNDIQQHWCERYCQDAFAGR